MTQMKKIFFGVYDRCTLKPGTWTPGRLTLLALFVCCLNACSSTKEPATPYAMVEQNQKMIPDAIRQHVSDTEKQSELLSVFQSYQMKMDSLLDVVEQRHLALQTALLDFDAEEDTLQKLFKSWGDSLQEVMVLTKERTLAMRPLCTEKEWKAILSELPEEADSLGVGELFQ